MARDELDLILEELANDIAYISKSEVREELKEIQQEEIQKVVYNHPIKPIGYDRRGEDDGLMDKENMEVDYINIKNGISLEMINTTTGNNAYDGYTRGYIDQIIETGDGYWRSAGINGIARPFIEATQDVIDNTDRIEEVIENELKKKGWSIK